MFVHVCLFVCLFVYLFVCLLVCLGFINSVFFFCFFFFLGFYVTHFQSLCNRELSNETAQAIAASLSKNTHLRTLKYVVAIVVLCCALLSFLHI